MKPLAPIIIKKKKSQHAAHHGGSWKVAYADFVTAMMAFFMVLWIMGLSEKVRIQIQGYFNDPMGFMKNSPRSREVFVINSVSPNIPGNKKGRGYTVASNQIEKAEKLDKQIKKSLQQIKNKSAIKLMKNVEITMTPDGLLIEFVESDHLAFFDLGSAVVRPEAKEIFLQVGHLLAESGEQMMINGHTDARPYQSKAYDNWDLSGARAMALKRVLMQGEVTAYQIECIKALGPTHLKRPDHPFDSENRRVSILLPFDQKIDLKANLPGNLLKEDMTKKNTTNIAPFPFPVTRKENKVEGYILGAPIRSQ